MPNTLPKPGAKAPRLMSGHHPNTPISRLALACGYRRRPDEQDHGVVILHKETGLSPIGSNQEGPPHVFPRPSLSGVHTSATVCRIPASKAVSISLSEIEFGPFGQAIFFV